MGVETFVGFGAWRNAAVLLNLVAFFCGFSAFSVGLLIASRLKRMLAGSQAGMLTGVVHAFLLASGALALRSLVIVLFHLNFLTPALALPLADLAVVAGGGAIFWAYLVFERYLSSKENAS